MDILDLLNADSAKHRAKQQDDALLLSNSNNTGALPSLASASASVYARHGLSNNMSPPGGSNPNFEQHPLSQIAAAATNDRASSLSTHQKPAIPQDKHVSDEGFYDHYRERQRKYSRDYRKRRSEKILRYKQEVERLSSATEVLQKELHTTKLQRDQALNEVMILSGQLRELQDRYSRVMGSQK